MLYSNVKLAEIKAARLSNGEGLLTPPEIRNLTQVFNSNFKTCHSNFSSPISMKLSSAGLPLQNKLLSTTTPLMIILAIVGGMRVTRRTLSYQS